MTQIVIASNGFPVRFVVPEPRVFALHKLWVSLQPTRDPIKRKRDLRQGEAVAQLALDYFNLRFDDPAIKSLPTELTAMIPGLVERLHAAKAEDAGRADQRCRRASKMADDDDSDGLDSLRHCLRRE